MALTFSIIQEETRDELRTSASSAHWVFTLGCHSIPMNSLFLPDLYRPSLSLCFFLQPNGICLQGRCKTCTWRNRGGWRCDLGAGIVEASFPVTLYIYCLGLSWESVYGELWEWSWWCSNYTLMSSLQVPDTMLDTWKAATIATNPGSCQSLFLPLNLHPCIKISQVGSREPFFSIYLASF